MRRRDIEVLENTSLATLLPQEAAMECNCNITVHQGLCCAFNTLCPGPSSMGCLTDISICAIDSISDGA